MSLLLGLEMRGTFLRPSEKIQRSASLCPALFASVREVSARRRRVRRSLSISLGLGKALHLPIPVFGKRNTSFAGAGNASHLPIPGSGKVSLKSSSP